MKRFIYVLISALTLTAWRANAQDNSGFDQLIKSGPGDATKLINAYAEPVFKGLGLGMNGGWNNTAKTKKFLHFDLRVTATLATPPASGKTFDVTKIGLSNHIRPASSSNTIAQTFAGDKNVTGPTMNIYDDNGNKISSFNMPSGQLQFVPTPQVQLTVGLPKNTDVTVRYVPDTKNYGFSKDVGAISMFGIGLKHDIAQDFSKKGKTVPFDLAIALGINKINYTKTLDVQPESGAQPANSQQSTDFSNQHIDGHFNSFMIQGILSKKLLFFTPFIAVTYNTAKTDVSLIGNYPITTSSSINNQKYYTTYPNPVSISNTSVNGLRGDVGFQLNLLILRIYASYGMAQEYHLINAGIGLGF